MPSKLILLFYLLYYLCFIIVLSFLIREADNTKNVMVSTKWVVKLLELMLHEFMLS